MEKIKLTEVIKAKDVEQILLTHMQLRFDMEEFVAGQRIMEFLDYDPKYYEDLMPWEKRT